MPCNQLHFTETLPGDQIWISLCKTAISKKCCLWSLLFLMTFLTTCSFTIQSNINFKRLDQLSVKSFGPHVLFSLMCSIMMSVYIVTLWTESVCCGSRSSQRLESYQQYGGTRTSCILELVVQQVRSSLLIVVSFLVCFRWCDTVSEYHLPLKIFFHPLARYKFLYYYYITIFWP